MKRVAILLSCFCATFAVLAQSNFTAISNLKQPTQGFNNGIAGNSSIAMSFITGPATSTLSSVDLSMGNEATAPAGVLGRFQVTLNGDASGSPGAVLATLLGSTNPATSGTYSYTNASPFLLTASTTYWIVTQSPDSTGGNSYDWLATPSISLDPGSIWTLGVQKGNGGSGWVLLANAHSEFSVAIVQPLAPAVSLFSPLLLTYTNSGFPFVLQQNTNLNGTNWVTATNAIQVNAANSNLTTFLMPATSPQLFYRLILQ